MEKPVIIRFDKEAYEEYRLLQEAVAQGKIAKNKPTYEQLLSSVNNSLKNIKANPFYGDLIPRKYISKGVVERYGTSKIFRVELTGYWRLLYTLIGDEVSIVALILEYINHDKYNRIFGYTGIK
jgi:hypothetical protein